MVGFQKSCLGKVGGRPASFTAESASQHMVLVGERFMRFTGDRFHLGGMLPFRVLVDSQELPQF